MREATIDEHLDAAPANVTDDRDIAKQRRDSRPGRQSVERLEQLLRQAVHSRRLHGNCGKTVTGFFKYTRIILQPRLPGCDEFGAGVFVRTEQPATRAEYDDIEPRRRGFAKPFRCCRTHGQHEHRTADAHSKRTSRCSSAHRVVSSIAPSKRPKISSTSST